MILTALSEGIKYVPRGMQSNIQHTTNPFSCIWNKICLNET